VDIKIEYIGNEFKEVHIVDGNGDIRYKTSMLSKEESKELGLDFLRAAMDLIDR